MSHCFVPRIKILGNGVCVFKEKGRDKKFVSNRIDKGNLLIKKHKKRCSKQYKRF